MTRQQLIDKGKIWTVYLPENPDNILLEGCKSKCQTFISKNYGMYAYKKGKVRLSKTIWELGMD